MVVVVDVGMLIRVDVDVKVVAARAEHCAGNGVLVVFPSTIYVEGGQAEERGGEYDVVLVLSPNWCHYIEALHFHLNGCVDRAGFGDGYNGSEFRVRVPSP